MRRSNELLQIHDSDMITGHPLEHIINGPAHHTLHHLYFTVNYGQVSIGVDGRLPDWAVERPVLDLAFFELTQLLQYFTWADKAGGSYRHPDPSLDPLLEVKALESKEAMGKEE